MNFGLWVEPEMVNPDSDLYRAHPDWPYTSRARPRSEGRNQLVLNLAREEVKEHIFGVLDKTAFGKRHTVRQMGHEPAHRRSPAGGSAAGRAKEILGEST